MRLALLCVIASICSAQLPAQTSVTGPVEALTFDSPTRSVRAVIGVPHSALFGPALLDNLDLASIAPGQTYGIVFEGGQCLFVSGLGSKKVSSAAISGANSHPDGVVWSGNGSLAILYSSSSGWFQSITGFPNAPVAGTAVEVTLGGAFAAVASDTGGQQIAVAVSGDNGGVYQFANGQFTRLASMAKPVSLSFSNDGQTLYALDAATLEVTAVSLGGHGFQTLELPGMANPIAIQSLEDSESRQVLYVAGGSDRLLRIVDVASQQILADVALNFQPTGIAPFGSSSFVLANRSQSANPLWLFASTPTPASYFVPAVQSRQADHRTASLAGRAR